MSKILISYRREDSSHVMGRIYDRLVQQFGRMAVFKDVDNIPLGIDFRTYLEEQVAKCDVFLAVIGRYWMKPQGQKGKSRLTDPADFVRLEIETALKRQIPVIPVLVEGASIPPVERLPTSLQGLSYRNCIIVRPDPDFHRDMDRLIEHLRAQIESQLPPGPLPDVPVAARDTMARPEAAHSEVEGPRPEMVEVAAPLSRPDSQPTVMQLEEDTPVESPDVHSIVRDGSEAAENIRSEGEQTGQEQIEAAARPSEADSSQRVEHSIKEALTTSIGTHQKTTGQSSTYLFGVIGLIILIGGVVAFLILRPTPLVKLNATNQPSISIPEMIRISPGSFRMGGSEEKEVPVHKVQFTKPFVMARYETTFDEYERFAQAQGRELPDDKGWGRGLRPVINVSWDDAQAYVQWLSQQTGKRYRLPTEAEWELLTRVN